MNDTENKETVINIKFPNREAAEHFMLWLCEQGEQDYWMWMEEREQEENGDITAVRFNYPFPRNKKENKDNFTIVADDGRLHE